MPDPSGFLDDSNAAPPQLFGLVRSRPFDVIKAELFDESRAQAVDDESDPAVDSPDTDKSHEAGDDATPRMKRIHDTLGPLALLEYSAKQARDDEQRLHIYREMHTAALPLSGDIEQLFEADDEGSDELLPESEDESPDHYEGNAIARGFAPRILDHPEVGCGWWGKRLISPGMNVRKIVSKLAEKGTKARAYDVAVDLDRGTVKVTPLPWWKGSANEPKQDAEDDDTGTAPAGDQAESLETERLGDESTYVGTAEFERLPNRWTVWTLEVHTAALPELRNSFRNRQRKRHRSVVLGAAASVGVEPRVPAGPLEPYPLVHGVGIASRCTGVVEL